MGTLSLWVLGKLKAIAKTVGNRISFNVRLRVLIRMLLKQPRLLLVHSFSSIIADIELLGGLGW